MKRFLYFVNIIWKMFWDPSRWKVLHTGNASHQCRHKVKETSLIACMHHVKPNPLMYQGGRISQNPLSARSQQLSEHGHSMFLPCSKVTTEIQASVLVSVEKQVGGSHSLTHSWDGENGCSLWKSQYNNHLWKTDSWSYNMQANNAQKITLKNRAEFPSSCSPI